MQSCPLTAAQRGDERHSPAVAFDSLILTHHHRGNGQIVPREPASCSLRTHRPVGAAEARAQSAPEAHRPFDLSWGSRQPVSQSTKLKPFRQPLWPPQQVPSALRSPALWSDQWKTKLDGVTEILTRMVGLVMALLADNLCRTFFLFNPQSRHC
jgi:hypothetical protein